MFKKWFCKDSEAKSEGIVTFLPRAIRAPIGQHRSLLDLALAHGVDIDHSCGGMGSCGTCRVVLESDSPPPRNEVEEEMARDRGFPKNERLACQVTPQHGMLISKVTE